MPTPEEFEPLAARLRALANAKRLALLGDLREPLYLEEIASRMRISRQAAQEHVDQLLAADLVEKAQGTRPSGPVSEYRVVQAEAFNVVEDLRALVERLPAARGEARLLRTQAGGAPAPGSRGDAPELLVLGGVKPGLKAVVHAGEGAPPVGIGRDPANGLVLDWDLKVSHRHAEVRALKKGHAVVDLFSRNGTLLNDAALAPGQPAPLRSGDVLQVGRTLVVYRA